MRDVSELRSELVAIYPPGRIPVDRIVARLGEMIKNEFGFATVGMKETALEFQHGTFASDEGSVTLIALTISARRVAVVVAGTSQHADFALNKLMGMLAEDEDTSDPLVVAPQTTCSVVLDFEWGELYSEAFMGFLGDLRSRSTTAGAEPRITDPTTAMVLKYQTPFDLEEHGIALSPKIFQVAPAAKTPLAQRRFVVTSPTRSEDHLRLIEELEAAVVRKRKGDAT